MANFEQAILNTFKAEGGFQQDPNDNANYVNKILIGTNRGISAQGYYSFHKKIPTVQQIKDLTIEQAKEIFKGNYWDKIAGDYIKNQSVSEMMFQFIIGSGQSQVSDIKDLANKTFATNVLVSNDLPITAMDANFINGLDQSLFFNNLWSWRKEFLTNLGNKPQYSKFKQGWLNRLETHKYKK